MNSPSDFWTSTRGQEAFLNIQSRGSQYWTDNVYRFFNRDSGKLGQCCLIELEDSEVVVRMNPIYSIQRDGTIHEYGQNIRSGISPGPGKFSPKKGYRLKTGYYPGVSVAKFWEPWMAEFEPALMQIVREEVLSGVRDFVKEQLTRGPT